MDLISIDQLSDTRIERILERSLELDEQSGTYVGGLENRIVFNLFYENSTRTLMSFATAAHRLGASVVTLPVERSSVQKGETLEDTARTLSAMQPDVIIVRHSENGAPALIADIVDCPVINAGDGTGEHPTQALLDAATIKRHFGTIEGLTVAICGDIFHSRVARSNIKLLTKLKATVKISGPKALLPPETDPFGAEVFNRMDEAIAGADVIMMLRVQRERMERAVEQTLEDYTSLYGLSQERLRRFAPNAMVMHPGPMNREIEIESQLADDPERSLITRQVEMGVAVRMACLEMALAGS